MNGFLLGRWWVSWDRLTASVSYAAAGEVFVRLWPSPWFLVRAYRGGRDFDPTSAARYVALMPWRLERQVFPPDGAAPIVTTLVSLRGESR